MARICLNLSALEGVPTEMMFLAGSEIPISFDCALGILEITLSWRLCRPEKDGLFWFSSKQNECNRFSFQNWIVDEQMNNFYLFKDFCKF